MPASIVAILFMIAPNSLQTNISQRLNENGDAMDMKIHKNILTHVMTQQSYGMALGNKDGTGMICSQPSVSISVALAL